MGYVAAGYVAVLGMLFLYAVTLVWRRRRLTRAALRLESLVPDQACPPGTTGRADDR
jgi:hypothetical protein